MKYTSSRLLLIILVFALGSIANVRAQWLTHSTVSPGTATSGAFPFGLGGFTTTSISQVVDGTGNGVPGISPNPFTNVTSTFLSYYSLNPTNTFDFLNVTSNDTGDFFKVTFEFSNLAGGVLPAGSTIAFLDVDNYENVIELSGFAQGGLQGQYNTPWLTQFAGTPPDAFDYDNAPGGVTSGLAAVAGVNGGFYHLTGDPSNQDSAFQGFTTNVPLGSLSFYYQVADPTGNANPAFDTYGIAIKAVPEPSTFALALLGGGLVAFAAARRNWRPLT